jgi:HlyD family secretion protein
MVKWGAIIVAAAGLALAVYTAATASHEAPKVALAAEPSVNPFENGIAATGMVEAASRNVAVAAPEGAVATRVFVEVGQVVKTGAPLFELDPRPLQADLAKAQAARESAAAALARVRAQPRAETLPALEAAVRSIQAEVADWTDQYERFQEAMKQTGGGNMELERRRFALDGAKARLAQAQANLALARAGAWGPDVEVAKADLAQAQAQVAAVQILLDRRTVRAPIDGTILKREIEPGQFAPAAAGAAAIVMGDLTTLHVRARVDEEDLPMLRAGAKGSARIRGRIAINVPLKMLRIEPLARPKKELSGDTTERVDTRVLEVIFEVQESKDAPLYPGQLVDVFIDGAPVN